MSRKVKVEVSGCGCLLISMMLLNVVLGGVSFDYCLAFLFAKDIPWYADMVAGLFLGEFTIPGMVVCWILGLCGVATPLFGG